MIYRIRIALIGSRSLHRLPNMEADIKLCHQICARFARLGIAGVSGLCAEGMDAIMQKEYSRAIELQLAFTSQVEVYVANIKDKRTSKLPYSHLALVMNPTKKVDAGNLAKSFHANWSNCSPYAKGRHTRNAFVIHGYHLDNPVDAVVTWAELDNFGMPMGGTGLAIRMAQAANIPVFNLNTPDKQTVLNQIASFLRSKNVHNLK